MNVRIDMSGQADIIRGGALEALDWLCDVEEGGDGVEDGGWQPQAEWRRRGGWQ